MFELSEAVGNNRDNRAEDVFKIKDTLSDIGFFDFGSNPAEPHGIFTRELRDGIRDFQKDNGLRVDGILKPKGETESVLRQKLAAEKPVSKRPLGGFVFVSEKQNEFDATGRRIRDQDRRLFEPMSLRFPNPQREFSEEAIKKKLQERQAKINAAKLERKNTDSEFEGLKVEQLMEDQEEEQKTVPVPDRKPEASKRQEEEREEKPQDEKPKEERDIKDVQYCISLSNRLRTVQDQIKNRVQKQASIRAKLQTKQDDLREAKKELGKLILSQMGSALDEEDFIKGAMGKRLKGPLFALGIVDQGMTLKQYYQLYTKISTLEKNVSSLEAELSRLGAELENLRQEEKNRAQEHRLNCESKEEE